MAPPATRHRRPLSPGPLPRLPITPSPARQRKRLQRRQWPPAPAQPNLPGLPPPANMFGGRTHAEAFHHHYNSIIDVRITLRLPRQPRESPQLRCNHAVSGSPGPGLRGTPLSRRPPAAIAIIGSRCEVAGSGWHRCCGCSRLLPGASNVAAAAAAGGSGTAAVAKVEKGRRPVPTAVAAFFGAANSSGDDWSSVARSCALPSPKLQSWTPHDRV